MSYASEGEGDNIEFTAVAAGDYDIWFAFEGTDSEFVKYPATGNAVRARKYELRADQSCDIIKVNNKTLTDPITVILNKAHTEIRDVPSIAKITVRTLTANTAIKVRWF